MKSSVHTYFVLCGFVPWLGGCAGAMPDDQTGAQEPYDREGVSSIVLDLMVVPASVKCLNVTVVVAGTSRAQTFAVTGGAATTPLNIGLLPLGAASITAEAYDAVCGSIAGIHSSWVADNVATTLKTGAPIKLQLVFRRNNPVNATARFAETIVKTSTNASGTLSVTASGSLLCSGTINGACSGATTPVVVSGIIHAVDVGVGTQHSCYIKQTGQMACFGANASGQLGTGVTSGTPTPAPGTVIPLERGAAGPGLQSHVCRPR